MTPKKSLWVYLKDMHNQAAIRNLETGQITNVYPANVADGAPIGLRGYLLEATQEGFYRETGEQILEYEEELFDELIAYYSQANNWIYDWPNYALDATADLTRSAELRERLTASMLKHQLPFEIIGLQERSLLYFTDGDHTSQKAFVTVKPKPTGNPYLRSGKYRSRYHKVQWSSQDRDNGVPYPEVPGVDMTPCLYDGRAWVVRFRLDGQIPAFSHCRIYVKEDGTFIASDWCQRHDFSSYHKGGINLQMGIYTFDSWIMGPCLQRAIQSSQFKGKTGKIQVEHVRDLAAKSPLIKRQTLEEALSDATKKVKLAASAEKGATQPIQDVVRDLLVAKPTLTDQQIINGFKKAVGLTLENKAGDGTKLAGVPVLVKGLDMYFPPGTKAEDYLTTPFPDGTKRYRFVLSPGACGATLQPGKACIRPDAASGVHVHPYFAQLTVDDEGLTALLVKALADVREASKPVVAVPPITGDAMKEALQVLQQQQEKALEDERARLLGTIADIDPNILPSVAPLLTTYDTPFGVAQIKRQSTDVVQVTWVSGAFEGLAPAFVRYDSNDESAELTRKLAKVADESAWEDCPAGTPIGDAVRWYFKIFLEGQHTAQGKALEKAVEVNLHDESFRCYPVVGGATICKVVDGAVIQAATVRKQANGHIYEVLDTGKTTSMEPSTLKDAASFYFAFCAPKPELATV